MAADMFKLKELLDGIIDEILDLPAVWFRTHLHAFLYGRRAPFIIAYRLKHGDKRYMRLRTAAFIDLLLILAISQANGLNADFGRAVLKTLVGIQTVGIADPVALNFVFVFFGLYYAFYAVTLYMPLRSSVVRVLNGACLFYATVCMLFLFFLFILLFGRSGWLSKDYFLRGGIMIFNVSVAWLVGSMFAQALPIDRSKRALASAAFAVGFLAVYSLVLWIGLGWESLWPNLRI